MSKPKEVFWNQSQELAATYLVGVRRAAVMDITTEHETHIFALEYLAEVIAKRLKSNADENARRAKSN